MKIEEKELVADRRKATRYLNQCSVSTVNRTHVIKKNWRDLCVCVFHYDYFPVASFFFCCCCWSYNCDYCSWHRRRLAKRGNLQATCSYSLSLSLTLVVLVIECSTKASEETDLFLFLFFSIFLFLYFSFLFFLRFSCSIYSSSTRIGWC
jgi:hypothetical protein